MDETQDNLSLDASQTLDALLHQVLNLGLVSIEASAGSCPFGSGAKDKKVAGIGHWRSAEGFVTAP